MGNGCVKSQVLPLLPVHLHKVIKKPVLEIPNHVTLRKANIEWGTQKALSDKQHRRSPTCLSKEEICSISSLHELDEYAQNTFEDFLNNPLGAATEVAAKYKEDLKKARVVFRWLLAAARMDRAISDEKPPSRQSAGCNSSSNGQNLNIPSPSGIGTVSLNSGSSPAEKFCQISSHIGVKSELVYGTVRTNSCRADHILDDNDMQRDWAAVYTNKEWRLVNVDLASEVDEHLADFYFFTNPWEFVYHHLPEDPTWQLLASPVSHIEFQTMEQLRPKFFQLGLQTMNSSSSVSTKYGETEISFYLPGDKDICFSYLLKKSEDMEGQKDQFSDVALEQCVFLEQRQNNVLVCKVSLPRPGSFILTLSAFDSQSEQKSQMGSICEYLITCATPKQNWIPIPQTERTVWGPTKTLEVLGLEPASHKQGFIYSNDGSQRIVFKSTKKVHVFILLEATEEGMAHLDLTQWTLLRIENGEVIIDVRLIQAGSYILHIHASVEKKSSFDMPVVCSYLLKTEMPVLGELEFPDVCHQTAGPTEHTHSYNVFPISHEISFFETSIGEISLVMNTAENVFFKTKFFYCFKNDREEINNRTMLQRGVNKVTFTIRFPKVGLYLFSIMAKKQYDLTEDVVFNYVIQVDDTQGRKCKALPKYFSSWGPECENYGPDEGILPTGEAVQLSVKIPGATQVMAIQDQWQELEQNEDGVWGKRITTTDVSGTDLKISACMDKTETETFHTYLQYMVIDRSEIDTQEQREMKDAVAAMNALTEQNNLIDIREKYFQKLQKDLEESLKKSDFVKLGHVVKYLETAMFTGRFDKLYDQGKGMVESYYKVQTLIGSLKKVKRSTLSDLKSYTSPPETVHLVTKAALLLLDVHEGETKEWSSCTAFFTVEALSLCITALYEQGFHPELAARAKEIVTSLSKNDITKLTSGPKYFYKLTTYLLSEMESLIDGGIDSVRPADLDRQKELLNENVKIE